jgi:anti-sigma-K factor RskA
VRAWLGYAVAAAAVAVAVLTSLGNLALRADLQTRVAEEARQRQLVAAIVAPDSRRFDVPGGEVVRHGDRLYLALGALPAPPAGHVYQAWTLANGARTVAPSVTFVPSRAGVALVELPVRASDIAAVAVSVEPNGGSRAPTTKPNFIRKLS